MNARRPSRSGFGSLLAAAVVAAGLFALPPAIAQQDGRPATPRELHERRQEAQEIQRRAMEAFTERDFERAERLFRRQAELDTAGFVPRYNLAVTLASLGRPEEGAEMLAEAIGRGFLDRRQLEGDPSLGPIRDTELYAEIVENWDRIIEAHADGVEQHLRRKYRPGYTVERDDELRIIIASAFHPIATEQAVEEMRRLAEWGVREIFKDLAEDANDPFVAVVLPTERDFAVWAMERYGPAAVAGDFQRIGGAYSNDEKKLVAMDIGSTFRHEFFHVLHWRSNDRLGQRHPVWIQEGLCSLVEDIDEGPGGTITPTPSWRTNILKRRLSAAGLPTIAELATMPRQHFTGRAPLANYAHARAIFLYLHERGELGAFYADYIDRYDEDRSGVASIERVLDADIEQIDRDFKSWLRSLPDVAEVRDGRIRGLQASIGVEVDPGEGEGPVVGRSVSRQARDAGLRPRDVIVSIDGSPTRDLSEFVRRLGDYHPGQRITLGVRRRNEMMEMPVVLSPAR